MGGVGRWSFQELALGCSWGVADRDVARRLGAAVDGDMLHRPPLLARPLSVAWLNQMFAVHRSNV
jgi:hypothetical protein